eukprot:6192390-Pleurochrysis_carterae.AAC.1
MVFTLCSTAYLYHSADKDDVIPPAGHVHKRFRYQLAFSYKFLMANTCVPPIHTSAHGTPDWWAAFKRTIMEICADMGEHGLDTVILIAELDVYGCGDERDSLPGGHRDRFDRAMKHSAFEVSQLLLDPGLGLRRCLRRR